MNTRSMGRLACGLLALAAFGGASAQEKPGPRVATGPTFTLKGRLVREDATPVKGATCMVHKAAGSGYSIETGEGGVVKNPTMKTDDTGGFAVTFARGFLPSDGKITITCTPPWHQQSRQLADSRGIPVIIEVAPKLATLDLEKTIGKITVK